MSSLGDLPEDIIFQIIGRLDTARDVAALSALSRQWHALIARDGWRIFVLTCFSTLDLDLGEKAEVDAGTGAGSNQRDGRKQDGGKGKEKDTGGAGEPASPSRPGPDWHALARHCTWQDRCWDTRTFVTVAFTEAPLRPPDSMAARTGRRGRGISFRTRQQGFGTARPSQAEAEAGVGRGASAPPVLANDSTETTATGGLGVGIGPSVSNDVPDAGAAAGAGAGSSTGNTFNTGARRGLTTMNSTVMARRQSAPFQAVVAAALHPSGGKDGQLVAVGAGENISGLFTSKHRTESYSSPSQHRGHPAADDGDAWRLLPGAAQGHVAGLGDVTALSVFELGAELRMLVGRASGDLRLLSAEKEGFGREVASLAADRETFGVQDASPPGPSPRSGSPGPWSSTAANRAPVSSPAAVSAVDWQPRSRLVLSGTRRAVFLHSLDASADADAGAAGILQAAASHDLGLVETETEASAPFSFVCAAKFVNPRTVACGLANSLQPLRWLDVAEAGFVEAHRSEMDAGDRANIFDGRPTTVRAIEPVGVMSAATGNENLMLSAWDDGTIR